MQLYKDSHRSPEERAEDLLSRMTLEEKLAQMTGYNPAGWSGDDLERDFPHGAGQVAFLGGIHLNTIYEAAVFQREIQEKIMAKSRFQIPAFFHLETLSGVMLPGAVSFPSGMGQAATFDPEHQKVVGELIGRQARAAGATNAFSPVLDISRDSRFGRQGETYGEDPVLASALGCAIVSGLQQGGNYREGVLATAKHFLGYHNSQGGIHAAACDIPERVLREIYAKPFQAAITVADLQSIMPCYSSVNGEPVAASHRILTGLLREEMGFEGLTVSDYCAVEEIYRRQGVGENIAEAGRKAILAGMNQELPSANCYRLETLQDTEINQELRNAIDESVRIILRAKFKLGLFENPFAASDEKLREIFCNPQNSSVTAKSALESIVLLKNNGVLPLEKRKQKIAVIGYHANSTRALFGGYTYMSMTEGFLGAQNTMAGVKEDKTEENYPKAVWEGTVVEKEHPDAESLAKQILPDCLNLLEELKKRIGQTEFLYSFGYPYTGNDCSGHEEALCTASQADIVLMAVGDKYGTGSTASMGEGIDGTNINLPLCQEILIEKIHKLGKPVVLVHFGGRPISSDAADSFADAIIEAWNPGEKGAEAIVSVLFGEYNPAGRMPVTTAYCAGQIPVYYNHPHGTSWHQNTISAFSQYMDCPHEPRYYFGHGLSYTKFHYQEMEIQNKTLTAEDELEVMVSVKNVGKCAGDEVVQLYIRDPHASMVRPVQELAGFYRVHLDCGEMKRLKFVMRLGQFAFLDEDMKWKVEKGCLEILVGASSNDIRLKDSVHVVKDGFVDGKNRGFYAEVSVE